MISIINRDGKKIAAEYYKKIEVLLLKKNQISTETCQKR